MFDDLPKMQRNSNCQERTHPLRQTTVSLPEVRTAVCGTSHSTNDWWGNPRPDWQAAAPPPCFGSNCTSDERVWTVVAFFTSIQLYYQTPKQVNITQKNQVNWLCNWMKCGHLSVLRTTSSGFGWQSMPIAARLWEFMSVKSTRQSALILWHSLPGIYRQCAVCYTNFWEAYEQVLPSSRHQAVGKETGKTCAHWAVQQHPASTSWAVGS